MTLPKIILVPTDFGEGSDAALDYAVELAKELDSEIVLLHVYDLPPLGFPDGALIITPDLAARLQEGASVGIQRTLRERTAAGVPMRGLVKQGDTWRAIVESAKETGAGLVVMGTHGRRGLPRALLGSVAEKVVRTAQCPVLTVHLSDVEPHRAA